MVANARRFLITSHLAARLPGRQAAFSRKFWQPDEWAAKDEAEGFLRERGFSVAPTQSHSNRGVMFGDYRIAKWRNLNSQERLALHGAMVGNMRDGPVTIVIFADAPDQALSAARRE